VTSVALGTGTLEATLLVIAAVSWFVDRPSANDNPPHEERSSQHR
jgi:hypothetical protein